MVNFTLDRLHLTVYIAPIMDLTEAYTENRASLLRYIAKITGDEDNAEDLLNDAWIRAVQTLERKPNETAEAVLVMCAKSVAMNYAAKVQRRDKLEDEVHGGRDGKSIDQELRPLW